jgi:D-alanyl-D-alanine carboxypeptidase/D-alanyl-D-alanine-endopeptidase (penicillin-binding protein 4)
MTSGRRAALLAGSIVVGVWQGSPWLAAAPPLHTRTAALRREIDSILSSPVLSRSYWGILVRSLDRDETLYTLNAGRLMMPASNLKILTLAAAADRLGWDFTYVTRVVAHGRIDNGTLDGDLVIVGSGDPSLTDENSGTVFDAWTDSLNAAGIRAVRGRIVGDDRLFADEPLGMGWSWDDLAEGYAAGVTALQYNENAAQAAIAPGAAAGAPAIVEITPPTSGLVVRNEISTGRRGEPAMVKIRRIPGSVEVEMSGVVPAGTETRLQMLSVNDPARYYADNVRAALIARGIDVQGDAVSIRSLETLPAGAERTTVIEHRSPPLSTLAVTLMKQSQNQYAETLVKTLGGIAGPPTTEQGLTAVRDSLQAWGVDPDDVIQRDGSGLSRYNYVTPEALVAVLTHIHRDERIRDPFEASLPIAGVDGTLEKRMRGSAAERRVRAKTGSMAGVRAWSGYVNTVSGETLVFSILANNFRAPADAVNAAAAGIIVRLATLRK